jgi:Spy/CpxP family protein refolding chaperone
MNPDTSSSISTTQPIGRKGWALAGLLALASASVVVSLNAWAAPHTDRHDRGDRCGVMQAGMGPGHHGDMGGMGAAMPFDAVHIEHLLDQVKATDAQRAQIRQIGDKARADLRALHEQMPGMTPQPQGKQPAKPEGASAPAMPPAGAAGPMGMMALLTQAKVDAAAAEKARQAMVAHHDAVSKRVLQGTLDIANALTAEQRVALGQAMQARHADRDEAPRHDGHGQPGKPGQPEDRKPEAK